MKIGILNKSKNPNPSHKTLGSAGLDLMASNEKKILIKPGERAAISTGIYLELPENVEAQVRPRSGLALSSGITVLNSPGTIDSDYRGEVRVILINLSNNTFIVESGDRIAQIVFAETKKVFLKNIKKLTLTERGDGGFGSTGTS